jgi:hypothetical protein
MALMGFGTPQKDKALVPHTISMLTRSTVVL